MKARLEVGYDAPVPGRQYMSQMNEIRETARELADGLGRLGPDRTVALSVHVTRELLAALEEKAKKLVNQLDGVD